ncbi:hypothetical protein SAMN05660865_01126 [Caloramator fervidus]|uniref:Uncharacterized protein n=1 Tax=Caloramator fervidus TaxID=29344 RepID=A0A1H5V6A3_9CLOT|nr:hypothetical protein [Caloramator fervidus]SEF82753.1 hypothetical protein SAMN05660865_01126 [Caloramator fervidus]
MNKKIRLFIKIFIVILVLGFLIPMFIRFFLSKNYNKNKDDAIFVVNYGIDEQNFMDTIKKILNIPK